MVSYLLILVKIDDSKSEFNELKSFVILKVVMGFKNESGFWVMAIYIGGKLGGFGKW